MPDIVLRPFERSDFGRLIGWVPTAEFLLQWSGPIFTWPLNEAQLDAYLASADDDEPARLIWCAAQPDGAVIGHVELNMIDRRHGSASLARVLIGPAGCRGQGLGGAMIRHAMQVAFDDLALHRLDLRVLADNAPALACYERLGFVREGVMREVRYVGGGFCDLVMMSMLEGEWRGTSKRDHPWTIMTS